MSWNVGFEKQMTCVRGCHVAACGNVNSNLRKFVPVKCLRSHAAVTVVFNHCGN